MSYGDYDTCNDATREKAQQALDMFMAGVPGRVIARELGMSQHCVFKVCAMCLRKPGLYGTKVEGSGL